MQPSAFIAIATCDSNRKPQVTSDLGQCDTSQDPKTSFEKDSLEFFQRFQ